MRHHLTFFSLSIGDLQIKICGLSKSLLVTDRFLEIADGNVKSVEGNRVEIQGRLKFVVDRHGGAGKRRAFSLISWNIHFHRFILEKSLTTSITRVGPHNECNFNALTELKTVKINVKLMLLQHKHAQPSAIFNSIFTKLLEAARAPLRCSRFPTVALAEEGRKHKVKKGQNFERNIYQRIWFQNLPQISNMVAVINITKKAEKKITLVPSGIAFLIWFIELIFTKKYFSFQSYI
jgi:hypothetical protein